MSWDLIFQHLFIVLAASLLSIAVGLPLGIWAYVSKTARPVILRIVDLLQTIPSLALLGIIMVVLDPGKLTVITGITLYSLLPIVRNTCLGLQEVDPGVKEAARGMGMSKPYRVLMVEFPLAFPTVFTGIRIAVVNAIGTAVFAAFVGGGGLGGVITQAIRISDMSLILAATGVLMVIAVVLDLIMSWFEGQMRKSRGGSKKMWIPVAAIVLAFILLLPYGRGGTGDILLYDGDYSETQLMHHMVKMLVEDQTDLTVTIQDQMSQVNNWNSLKDDSHTCDLMISYDGTILTTFLGQDTVDVPEGMTIYDYVQGELDSYGLTQLEQLGFENTYAIGVPQALADEYGLETISDLIPIADQLTFGAEQEFFTLEGSMKYDPFVKFYGLNFQDAVSVDMGLKYSAIENGSFDVAVVYSTDGLNKKVGLKVLEDDQSFFPDYNGVFLVRDDLLEKYPEVADILKNATQNSLIIFDEIGRGTSTFDGMSIARAVLEYVHDKKLVGAKTLFATHYHELTALEDQLPGVKNFNIAVKKRGDDITFLRRIVRGGADDSFGIEVAKLAGVPEKVIRRAKQVLAELEKEGAEGTRPSHHRFSEEPVQLTMDTVDGEVLQKLRSLDVNALTPIQCMNTLFELCSMLK